MIRLCRRQNDNVVTVADEFYKGSSDEGEIDCDVTTQSSEEEEEEELMEEMTRGPSREASESADDLTVRHQTPQDLSLMKTKEEEEDEEEEEEESLNENSKDERINISENFVSTTSAADGTCDDKKNSSEDNRSENLYLASEVNADTPNRYNYLRDPDDPETPVRLRSLNDLMDVPTSPRMIPPELKLRESGRGVWARGKIPRGTRYGPFVGKWVHQPVDSRFAWEVRVPGSNIKEFLDGSLEPNNWMKFVRSASRKEQNLRHFLLTGQIYYETIQDIREPEELLLGPRKPLQLDMFGEAAIAEHREAETASQHSGTLEDDREDIENEENETRCTVCNKVYPDVEQLDDHLVRAHRYPYEHFKCDRCPRAFSWRPGLLRHQTIKHGAVKKYPCENCNKIFTDPSNLQRHIRTHHVGARSHACAECGKTFATSSGLKQHTHIHSTYKPFKCKVCFRAYTQFSNLCRHRRNHADCQLQIKCGRCGQSFSSVTSQTKHKRFCDSTSSPATGATALPISQSSPTMNMQGTTPSNPLFMYTRPPLPFYPSSLLGSYPSLFPPNNTHPSAAFMNNPVLFPLKTDDNSQKLLENISSDYQQRILNQRKRSYENERSVSPDRKRRMMNSLSQGKEIHITPSPPPHFKAKVSPSAAEEAVSLERPSPARPSVGGVTSTYPNPRELLSPDKPTKVNEEPGVTKLSPSPAAPESSKEQPLDLRVTRKRNVLSTEEVVEEEKPPSPKVSSPSEENKPKLIVKKESRSPSPVKKKPNSPEYPEQKIKLNLHSPAPEPATSIPTSSTTSPPTMAYPRPIHPMLLEAMYRPSGFPQTFPHQNDRLLGPPPPPFGPPATFPFLGSLMNGLPNGQSNQRSFDLLRNPLPGFAGVKPYQDVLTSHIGNGGPTKMKERHACRFCKKIFPRSANLTRHIRTHTGEQPYECQYCKRSFSISSNLQRHVRNIHNKEKPFKCPSCEKCFGQQTNLDRHLKKHEADDGSGNNTLADSSESNPMEKVDACFHDIRTFMGKVTYSADSTPQIYSNHSYTSPRLKQDAKEGEDSETLSEEHSPTPSCPDDRTPLTPKTYPLPLTYDVKVKAEQEAMNNNTPDQEPIEVAT